MYSGRKQTDTAIVTFADCGRKQTDTAIVAFADSGASKRTQRLLSLQIAAAINSGPTVS